ncbi:MAG TPA: glycosyltransferase family 9 protein [Thermomicrobiales bacterium]|nr:glycosyltransferase family 9 protein [Thermomicrobiales bacterium]
MAAADRLLAAGSAIARPFRRRRVPAAPQRILLLRLERIGDLLMALPAIAAVRALAPRADIDLVVGSWNADLAQAIDAVNGVQTLDAAWLARGAGGRGVASLLRAAREWRARRYDLVINFEPDIRSNLLAAAAGATWTVGYRSGGGGALLDVALDFDARAHTTDNATRLVAAAFGSDQAAGAPTSAEPDRDFAVAPILIVPADAHNRAARLLGDARSPLIGMHVSGGRPIKQWPAERFGEVACRLVALTGGTIVLSGSNEDRELVEIVRRALPAQHVVDLAGHLDLLTLGAILEREDLLVTGDTGPMHLAAAVGTPIVAVFGPSDPARYAPRGRLDRVVRVDLPCSPCNRIRLPPARCIGHTPDCLASIGADPVLAAARAVLEEAGRRPALRTDASSA